MIARTRRDDAHTRKHRLIPDVLDGEALVSEQRPETPAAERTLMGVVVPDPSLGIRRACVHARAGSQHAPEISDQRSRVVNVLQQVLQNGRVKRSVIKWKRLIEITDYRVDPPLPGICDCRLGVVNTGVVREMPGQPGDPTAYVKKLRVTVEMTRNVAPVPRFGVPCVVGTNLACGWHQSDSSRGPGAQCAGAAVTSARGHTGTPLTARVAATVPGWPMRCHGRSMPAFAFLRVVSSSSRLTSEDVNLLAQTRVRWRTRDQPFDDLDSGGARRLTVTGDPKVRLLRSLIRSAHAGKPRTILHLPSVAIGIVVGCIKALGIPGYAHMKRRVYPDLKQPNAFGIMDVAGKRAVERVRGHERDDRDHARSRHDRGNVRNPTRLLSTIVAREPKITAETVPEFIAVEDTAARAKLVQECFEGAGNRRLSRTREPRQPHGATFGHGVLHWTARNAIRLA